MVGVAAEAHTSNEKGQQAEHRLLTCSNPVSLVSPFFLLFRPAGAKLQCASLYPCMNLPSLRGFNGRPLLHGVRSPILILIVLATGFWPACSRRSDPNEAFDHAWETFQNGDLIKAQKEASKGYERFHTLSSDWAWKFTILNARVLARRGMHDEALKLMRAESAPGPEGETEVKKLWLQGLLFTSLHNFQQAENELTSAEQRCTGTNYITCEDVATARGALEMERGHYAQAQVLYARVLDQARANHDEVGEASALLDLSHAADEQTHFDEALDWADAARKLATSLGFADVSETALGNMGWAYYKLGDWDRAEGMFLEAENEAERLGNLTDQARWYQTLGYLYLDAEKQDKSAESFERSLAIAKKIHSREHIINSLIALAFVSEQAGKLNDAKRYADEALSMARADGNKRDETYPRLVQGRVAAQQHDPAAAEAAFHEVAESKDSPVFLKWEAERSLARLYEDESQIDSARGEYRTALSTFEGARSELQHENSRLPFLTNASGIYDDYIQFLVARGKTAEALQVAEYNRARTLNEGLGLLKPATDFRPDPLNAQAIAQRLGGTILFYWLGEKQSYLWAITAQKTSLYTLPAKSEIDPVAQRYRKALAEQQEFLPTADEDGRALYRTLVAPAQPMLPKKTDGKVFIVPDGTLNTLNFETLLVADQAPRYWIEDVTIVDASSLRLLATSRASTRHPDSLLLLGNAVAPNTDYPELRKAAKEMEIIEKNFPATQQQVFARERATPTAYLGSKPEQFSYIHFVAHGTASRMSPLDSAIVLSRASKEDDSFKLYARDVIRHPLRADLVTISTCYGAGTRAYSGEGLVGLSWAFLRAGAHNVIGALWEVSDVSTPQLMDELYRGLKQGKTPDSALRAAKLSMLHSGNAFHKPFYWAPFQLYTGS
jgi:CHAT domain-containing protein/Tfp pilus assembly protein PilF